MREVPSREAKGLFSPDCIQIDNGVSDRIRTTLDSLSQRSGLHGGLNQSLLNAECAARMVLSMSWLLWAVERNAASN